MKIFKIVGYTSAFVWGIIGILIIASIINETMGFPINIFMGFVFIAIAYFLYVKNTKYFSNIADKYK